MEMKQMKHNRTALRLRKIPANTVVHIPTKKEARELLAILKENGYMWGGRTSLIADSEWEVHRECTCCYISSYVSYGNIHKYNKDKTKPLTLAEFKERYVLNEDNFAKSEEEKPQTKFNVGDKVRVIKHNCWHSGQIGIVRIAQTASGQVAVAFSDGGGYSYYSDECLELYTEPETKEPVVKENLTTATKELNLCELLKGYEGEEFYSPLFGPCELRRVKEHTIVLEDRREKLGGELYQEGYACFGGEIMLYPSRALYEQYPLDAYAAWMKWKEEQKKPFICIHWGEVDCNGDEEEDYAGNTYFRTATDRDKCIEVIDAFLSQIQQSKSAASLCEEIKATNERYSKQ